MSQYIYTRKTVRDYLTSLYASGLKRSQYLQDSEIEAIVADIGIFKFKGYVYAFRPLVSNHSIDEALIIYFFDKYLTRIVMDMTSTIETKLKAALVESCYSQTSNPFFYLIQSNHRYPNFKLNKTTLDNWKATQQQHSNATESYLHYNLYYKRTYDFSINQAHFLQQCSLTTIRPDVNYPPFHYLVESATLGSVIFLIKSLKIGNYDILRAVANTFGAHNPRIFKPYLERLNEVRNRAAHRERLFNRSYRSVTGINHFQVLRAGVNNHKFVDVYMFLFFMQGQIDHYRDIQSSKKEEIKRLFGGFHHDYFIRQNSKQLTKKMKHKKFEEIMDFVYRNMI